MVILVIFKSCPNYYLLDRNHCCSATGNCEYLSCYQPSKSNSKLMGVSYCSKKISDSYDLKLILAQQYKIGQDCPFPYPTEGIVDL